ncbi:DNA-binding protein [Stenotrophomonas sp. PS02298]|uniref:DNA-binding protein n=1 Tax=Stenotrophomonas sp. PS02298 TaxID=2991424 RepID=UPI00249A234E|nr:DNA-binding protein [Stenotrophomonas sp. PS02298]
MSRPAKVISSEQVKQRLRSQGVTITAWAEAHGYTRNEVYRVLNGQHKGHFGKAHDIAVALGMKAANDQPTTRSASCNLQSAEL